MDALEPKTFSSPADLIEDVVASVGGSVVLGLPIAVGKPTHIANEFYRRAKSDPDFRLVIVSGLTLETPRGKSELERRFLEPLVARLYPDYPNPEYVRDAKRGKLPPNVDLREFYLPAGALIHVPAFQQGFVSCNYTHVSRDVAEMGCNVTATMACRGEADGRRVFSLGSNADSTVDSLREVNRRRAAGARVAALAQVNRNLPFTHGATVVEPGAFSGVLDNPALYHKPFCVPREPVGTTDYFIGLNASALIRDGGTIQVGFGSLGDAFTYCLQFRNERNETYRRAAAGLGEKFGATIDRIGGLDEFKRGLYGGTEFLSDGIFQLLRAGIIKRRVYDNLAVQSLVSRGVFDGGVTREAVEALLADGAIGPALTRRDFDFLVEYGIFRDGLEFADGRITAAGETIDADLSDAGNLERVCAKCLGGALKKGVLIHAGFFLGPESFYDSLMNLDEETRRSIQMREISFVNQLYGEGELKKLHRRDARFVNITMMVTLLGAAVSDTLEDGQVVSGVGGQYNFVSMAHALPDGRSILILRGTRMKDGKPLSNIVYANGGITIPRHLRDIVVTEYGIAELRGRTDSQVMLSLINVADSRFQVELLERAKAAGKVPRDARIPGQFRGNLPETLEKTIAPFRAEGCFPAFPYGTELTREELSLAKALRGLKERMKTKSFRLSGAGALKLVSAPAAAKPYLERMGLDAPQGARERLLRTLVLYALISEGVV